MGKESGVRNMKNMMAPPLRGAEVRVSEIMRDANRAK